MSDTIQTVCRRCGQKIEANVIYAGEMSKCPTCGALVPLPKLPDNPPPRKPAPRPHPALLQPVKPAAVWQEYLSAFFILLLSGVASIFFGVCGFLFLPALFILGHLGAISIRLREIETTLKNRP